MQYSSEVYKIVYANTDSNSDTIFSMRGHSYPLQVPANSCVVNNRSSMWVRLLCRLMWKISYSRICAERKKIFAQGFYLISQTIYDESIQICL